MGGGQNDVKTNLIFMLAINNPDNQVKTLSKLMSIFSSKDDLASIYNSKDNSEIFDKVSKITN